MRVFLDTNVWLSAVVFPGLCSELVAGLIESKRTLLTSRLIHKETCDVITRKFSRHTQAIALFDQVWKETICIDDANAPEDDADARLIAAAAQSAADLFVTGDLWVLGWNPKEEMQIVSPREAWTLLFLGAH